jgi:hypothetical protein
VVTPAVIAGPPKELDITVQDPDDGIASIVVTDSTNATVTVPSFFEPGTWVTVLRNFRPST